MSGDRRLHSLRLDDVEQGLDVPSVIFRSQNGEVEVTVPAGTSVMRAAVNNGVDGIVAECGGSAMCATCHVYVEETQFDLLTPMNDTENAMLDSVASERKPNSRLSCQIVLDGKIESLAVTLPSTQV